MTGFAHGTVLSIADKVIDAVKKGDIKHFLLVAAAMAQGSAETIIRS